MSSTSPEGMYICSTLLPTLGTVVVGLRFYTRMKLKMDFKFDDWAQIPALVLFVGMAIAALIGVANKAFGYPSPAVPPTFTPSSTILCHKLGFALQLLQILDLALIKIAALSFFRRVFCTYRPSLLNSIIWTLIFLIAAWAITLITVFASVIAKHPNAAWEGDLAFARYGFSAKRFEEAYAVTDFSFDFLVLAVPIPSIWALKTSLARKISITSVFMLALVGLGASLARLVIFVQLAGGTAPKPAFDTQTEGTQAVWISMIETGLALIAVNLPSIWGLVSHSSITSVLGSLKEILSPRSTKNPRNDISRRYAGLDDDEWRIHKSPSDQTSQDIRLVNNAQIDTLAVRDDLESGYQAETANGSGGAKKNGIDVRRSIMQTETRI